MKAVSSIRSLRSKYRANAREMRAVLRIALREARKPIESTGGFLFNALGARGVSGLNLYSLFVAVVGSVLFLVIYHAMFRRA